MDERTDVFSLGMTLFELFYGCPAFGTVPAESSRERIAVRLLERQRRGPTVPAGKQGSSACAIGKIIARCLEFDPRLRPQSMAELATLLSAQLKAPRRVGRFLGDHRWLTLGVATAACAVLAVTTGWHMARDPYPIRKWRQGEAAFQRGDDSRAVLDLTDALEHAPQLFEARLLRARSNLRQKNFVAAFADLEPLAGKFADGRATAGLAHAFAAVKGDYGMATAHYRHAIEQGYCPAVVYNNLGFCLAEVGQLHEAEAALKKALQLDPQLAAAYHSLARIEFQLAMAELRIPSTGPIAEAIKFGLPTGQLDLDGARCYAVCSKLTTDDGARSQYVDQAFWLLNRGLEHGLSAKHLQSVAGLNRALTADPRWPILEKRQNPQVAFTRSELLLDPLADSNPQPRSVPAAIASR